MVRVDVQPWIKYVIGDGRATFLWFDNWHSLGPLYQRFGESVVFNLRRSLQTKVDSIIQNDMWKWPRPRNAITKEIMAGTSPSLIPNTEVSDSVRWSLNGSGKFSLKSAWNALRTVYPEVSWAKGVWFSHNVPRWAFIEWLTFLGRLSTKDRLLSWGLGVNATCTLWHGR